LSAFEPNEQSPHRSAGTRVEPIHFPHTQQLSPFDPNAQLLHRCAGLRANERLQRDIEKFFPSLLLLIFLPPFFQV
jgi:hypothetical protein